MVIEPVPDLVGYFRDAIGAASVRRRFEARPETADYLAQLLASFGSGAQNELIERSLVLRLDEALQRPHGTQLMELQAVGDGSLYLVSFFPDAIDRAQLDVSLYVNVGAFAYGRAAEIARVGGTDAPYVFLDLRERFTEIADVLGEVAASSALGTVTKNVVRLFERWKNTGSALALEAMARAGAYPIKGGGSPC